MGFRNSQSFVFSLQDESTCFLQRNSRFFLLAAKQWSMGAIIFPLIGLGAANIHQFLPFFFVVDSTSTISLSSF
jgi:hypothetical protein